MEQRASTGLTPLYLAEGITRLGDAITVVALLGGLIGEALGVQAALLVAALGLFLGSVPYALARVGQLRSAEQLTPALAPVG